MDWFIPLLLAGAVFAALCAIGMMIDRSRNYVPVQARVMRSDYSVAERNYDHDGALWADATLPKLVEMQMNFTTEAGEEVFADHNRWVIKGDREKPSYRIWYHIDNPKETTGYGPAFWAFTAMLSIIMFTAVMIDPAAWLEGLELGD